MFLQGSYVKTINGNYTSIKINFLLKQGFALLHLLTRNRI